MGDSLNLPKSPTQSSSPPPPPPPPPPNKSNMPMLYYGLVVVATAAIVLAIYNLIIVRWCATQYRRSRDATDQHFGRRRNAAARNNNLSLPSSSLSRGGSTVGLTSSFRYKKEIEGTNIKTQLDYDTECAVCLSAFEDGDEVRKLPSCNHSFHASCIDMWLYSHSDCPLCRAPVEEPPLPPPLPSRPSLAPHHQHTDSALSEHSRDGLLDRASSSVSV